MKPEAPLWLPLLNAALIVISGLFLTIGYVFIRHKQVQLHRRSMIIATVFAGLFLVVYVTRYLLFDTRIFAGDGAVRIVYLIILISHTILAVAVGPLVLVTLRRALRGDYVRHRTLARITAPIWAYVVVTGWVIYMMLYSLEM
jgi:putative membrane protein